MQLWEESEMPVIITDSIEKECINLLSLYKDNQYVKESLLKSHPNLSESKQKNLPGKIKSFVVQGLDFLGETDENIKTAPLTLFYSIYNFSKAIHHFNSPNISIANAHGLKLISERAQESKELGDISVSITKSGAFVNLLAITGDSIMPNDVLVAKDIFALVPELSGIYALRYLEESNVFLLQENRNGITHYDLLCQTNNTHALDNKDFSIAGNNGMCINIMDCSRGPAAVVYRTEACTPDSFENATYCDAYGNRYLTCGLSTAHGNYKLSKIAELYLIYYMFGMLVRYYPEKWMEYCDNADSTLIRKLVINMRREMLIEVLQ